MVFYGQGRGLVLVQKTTHAAGVLSAVATFAVELWVFEEIWDRENWETYNKTKNADDEDESVLEWPRVACAVEQLNCF
jgi:hypothetical protein